MESQIFLKGFRKSRKGLKLLLYSLVSVSCWGDFSSISVLEMQKKVRRNLPKGRRSLKLGNYPIH